MVGNGNNLEKGLDPRIPDKLSDDMKVLFEPLVGVPPEVDRAVLDRACKHFQQVPAKGERRRFRRVWLWRAAAAAAVVILAFSLDLTKRSERMGQRSVSAVGQTIDIDQNGRVDILDAFKLARQIETAGTTEQDWDVNHDGLVDRHDVDMVAFAAVRLDRGVL